MAVAMMYPELKRGGKRETGKSIYIDMTDGVSAHATRTYVYRARTVLADSRAIAGR
jgi:hypothetical protein